MDRKSVRWHNQYRLVPKLKAGSIYERSKSIHETNLFQNEKTPTLEQLMMKDNYVISYDLKEGYNHVPVAEFIYSTISGLVIQISILPEQHAKSVHTNHEKSYSSNQRIMESQMCDLIG
jgi:hypothetical protein